jgi:hypothetical protein
MVTQGQGAGLRDILAAEFALYDLARISMKGPECLLSAFTIALSWLWCRDRALPFDFDPNSTSI